MQTPRHAGKLIRKDGATAWEKAAEVRKSLPIEFYSTNRTLADIAADLKARFKISLADAFAAALRCVASRITRDGSARRY